METATSPANRQQANNGNAIFYVTFGVCLLLYLSTFLISTNPDIPAAQNADEEDAHAAHHAATDSSTSSTQPPSPPKKRIVVVVKPPTTPASHRLTHILPDVLDAYALNRTGCTPEDVDNAEKHKVPRRPPTASNRQSEPKSAIVIYVAVALLLMSLGATLVDFCKAKSELKQNRASHSCRKKPALTRRCSLADLTVLRHTRKELLRKESFCGMPTAGANGEHHASGGKHWKINRPPLRFD